MDSLFYLSFGSVLGIVLGISLACVFCYKGGF